MHGIKKISQLLVFMVLAASATGCASPYMLDRGRDAADIFTAGIGIGGGVKARVGPVQTGMLLDFPFAGLRGGELVTMTPGGCMPQSGDGVLLHVGGETFADCSKDRGKQFYASTLENDVCGGFPPFVMVLEQDSPAPYYYTQIECVIGFLGTIRLGFNPGELLDFVLGWTTLDIFNDDVTRRRIEALELERQKSLTLEERRKIRDAHRKDPDTLK